MFADLADLGPARLGRLVFATFLPHLQFPAVHVLTALWGHLEQTTSHLLHRKTSN